MYAIIIRMYEKASTEKPIFFFKGPVENHYHSEQVESLYLGSDGCWSCASLFWPAASLLIAQSDQLDSAKQ